MHACVDVSMGMTKAKSAEMRVCSHPEIRTFFKKKFEFSFGEKLERKSKEILYVISHFFSIEILRFQVSRSSFNDAIIIIIVKVDK